MKGIFFLLWLTFYCLVSSAQESVPLRLQQLNPGHTLINFLPLDSILQSKPQFNYELILSQGNWYVIGNGDGQVFTPENGKWKRIDKTRLEGYHYGAFLFDCNGTLMKYGGYGFWRNHGMFVKFSEAIGDWQIQPSNRDLPFNGNLAYFHKKENELYTFGNFEYNQSISENKLFLDSLFRIDLHEMKWENLGKLNSTLLNKFHLHYRLTTLPNNQGCFILPISSDSTALYFNFETLQYNVYNAKNNKRLFRFFKPLPPNHQVYSDSYGLKILSNDILMNIDSITWELALSKPLESANIIEVQPTTSVFKYYILVGVIGVILGLILVTYFFKKKKSRISADVLPTVLTSTTTLDLSITNNIVFDGALYPIDSNDYSVILKFSQQDATTIDLNEWLGLENKQPENQKKQRAEWIKRMNSLFQSIGFKEEAFKRERLETDKRMFVYKMHPKLKPNILLNESSNEN